MKKYHISTLKYITNFLNLLLVIFVIQNAIIILDIICQEKNINIHKSIFNIGFFIFYISIPIILLIIKKVISKHLKLYSSF